MNKKKTFYEVNLSVPMVEHERDTDGSAYVAPDALQSKGRLVEFPPNAAGRRSFDFGPFYGRGIDEIVYAYQVQIERFLAKQDSDIEVSTVVANCKQGLPDFFEYLSLRRIARNADIGLRDIDRDTIDGYLAFLRETGLKTTAQKNTYSRTKAVLKALCRRGLIREVIGGDNQTFPENPFPGSNRKHKGAKPLNLAQRTAVTRALREAVAPLFVEGVAVTSELLSYALLVIALHTGRNTTPLLEMERDCLHAHPKEKTKFLVVYKRRGNNSSRVALQGESAEERATAAKPSLRANVVRLVEILIEHSDRIRADAPAHARQRILLYRSMQWSAPESGPGSVTALSGTMLGQAISRLVKDYDLLDADGKPLQLTVSRLRKTFINRVFEILDGDIVATARAAGNSASVVQNSYLTPAEDAEKNWRFMGNALVSELLSSTLGATERTPVGGCSDIQNGEYAPKRDGTPCMSFFNCLRCRNYVVTGDDLYRLFSFYWRLLKERSKMAKRRWKRQFAHIVRLIDRDVVREGIAKKIFKADAVAAARARARRDPHPFWSSDTVMSDIGGLA